MCLHSILEFPELVCRRSMAAFSENMFQTSNFKVYKRTCMKEAIQFFILKDFLFMPMKKATQFFIFKH